MIYIIDAYNVIYKIRRLEAALDKDLRTTGCAHCLLQQGRFHTRYISKIILVFDGKSDFWDFRMSPRLKWRSSFRKQARTRMKGL